MTTIIDNVGRLKAFDARGYVSGPWGPYPYLIGAKVRRATTVDASGGATISWEAAIFDTHRFVTTFPNNYVTVPMQGWYAAIAYINTAVTTAHMGQVNINVNDVTQSQNRVNFTNNSGIKNGLVTVLPRHYCVKGDKFSVTWDSGGVVITLSPENEMGCTLTVLRVA